MIFFHEDATHLDDTHLTRCTKSNADIVHVVTRTKTIFYVNNDNTKDKFRNVNNVTKKYQGPRISSVKRAMEHSVLVIHRKYYMM
jgi:hypothetical protein